MQDVVGLFFFCCCCFVFVFCFVAVVLIFFFFLSFLSAPSGPFSQTLSQFIIM